MSEYPEVPVTVKIEVSDTEDEVICGICCKVFASEMALRNHTRLQHFGSLSDDSLTQQIKPKPTPTDNQVTKTKDGGATTSTASPESKKRKNAIKPDQEAILKKTAELIASMAPTNVNSLASQDVNYILIKPNKDGSNHPPVVIKKRKDQPSPSKARDAKARKFSPEDEEQIQKKTKELLGSMAPHSLTSLASRDVSYIIIKGDKNNKGEKAGGSGTKKKRDETKKMGLQEITGPFECLEECNQSTDGLCHKMFFTCCEYSVHFRDVHTRRRKGPRCQVCERLLSGNGQEPDFAYPCDVCAEGFDTAKDLSYHIGKAHEKLKPFECGVCLKRFTQQSGVQQHMRMHTGERPYACPFCVKKFTQKSGLDQHIRTHTKVKPYRCVVCSKTFAQPVQLKQHMRTHTQITPFKCHFCSKGFKQRSQLTTHLKSHDMTNMSLEQKMKYLDMMRDLQEQQERDEGMLKKHCVVLVHDTEPEGEAVVVEEVEMDETAAMMEEQYLAEQSIQREMEE